MYRIDIGKLENLRAAAGDLKNTLTESAERLETEAERLQEGWEGDAVEGAIEAGRQLTQEMTLAATYLQMLETVLDTAEDSAMYLKSRIESLEAVLEGEAGTTIGVYVNTESEREGILLLNEELTETIVKNCNEATENAVEIEKVTKEIEELFGSLEYAKINVYPLTESILADCKNIKRLEEYGRIYGDYAEKMTELDGYITDTLSKYLPEEKVSCQIYEPALWAGVLNMTRILYLMETGEENLTEEEQGELAYALSYIKEGKDKNGTAMLLYEYLCLCGTERELTDIEKDYLAWGTIQLELVLLAYYGSEEERYEKVLTLLEKETWTEEETLFLCTEMEYYTSGGDTDKIAAIAEKLYTGYYEERNNLGITATYYKLGAEKDKIAALSQTCAGMGYSNAARLLGCVGETSTWGIETQIQEGETGSYYIEYCTAKDGTITMRLVIGIEGGEEGDGLWKEVTFGNDMGIALLSDEEVVEAYESIDNYNVIERSFSDEKNSDYIYKQMMESRYRSIKLAEAERIVNEYGLEEYLRVLYNPEAVTTAEERENAVKKTDELNEMGIDTLWLGTYYLHKQDEERLEETAEWAEEHEFISSLYSVPLKLGGSSCAALYQAGCYLSGTPINTDSTWYTDLKQANIIRGTVSEEIGELSVSIGDVEVDLGGAGQIGYQAVMGLADYALANTLTVGHGEILMAVEGYGESGYEAAARGLSPDAIQMLGINSAMSNVLTDKILLRACRGQHGFVRSVTEGSAGAAYEWLLTDTVDNLVSGDLSRESSYYRTALAEGQTPEEAKATICEIRKQELLQAMAVGGTMSGMAWGYGRAVDYLINRINPGPVSPDTPESVTPLQEEGISEILGIGDSGDVSSESGSGVKYSPVNPGPLAEDVANSFNGATYTERVLTEDTVMYRVSGGAANEVGSYMSRTPQGGGLQAQLDLALNPAWGNTTENVTKVIVPKGTIIYEGIAAPQNIYDSLGNVIGILPGGGNQIYIPTVEARWFQ